MKASKNIVVVVVSVIVVLLLLGAAAMLVVGGYRLRDSRKKLTTLKDEWKQFYQQEPFPSRENVLKVKEDNKVIDQWFDELTKALRQDQVLPGKNKSAALFKDLLVDTRNKMVALAAEKKVTMPDKFAFGFSRYLASGELPAPENVPYLAQQLLIIESLYRLFLDADIKELTSVQREEFDAPNAAENEAKLHAQEGAPGMPPGSRAEATKPGVVEGDALYGKLHFVFEFKAGERAVWDVLSRLANQGMIVVVTSVRIDSAGLAAVKAALPTVGEKAAEAAEEAPAKGPPRPQGLQARLEAARKAKAEKDQAAVEAAKVMERAAPQRIPSRQERLVSGPSKSLPVNVRIELDVYRFKAE